VYPATIVGIPPMEDFYIGGASVKLFLPIFKMNFPEIVDIALPAEGVFHRRRQFLCWEVRGIWTNIGTGMSIKSIYGR
jgi:hypothetical protein